MTASLASLENLPLHLLLHFVTFVKVKTEIAGINTEYSIFITQSKLQLSKFYIFFKLGVLLMFQSYHGTSVNDEKLKKNNVRVLCDRDRITILEHRFEFIINKN